MKMVKIGIAILSLFLCSMQQIDASQRIEASTSAIVDSKVDAAKRWEMVQRLREDRMLIQFEIDDYGKNLVEVELEKWNKILEFLGQKIKNDVNQMEPMKVTQEELYQNARLMLAKIDPVTAEVDEDPIKMILRINNSASQKRLDWYINDLKRQQLEESRWLFCKKLQFILKRSNQQSNCLFVIQESDWANLTSLVSELQRQDGCRSTEINKDDIIVILKQIDPVLAQSISVGETMEQVLKCKTKRDFTTLLIKSFQSSKSSKSSAKKWLIIKTIQNRFKRKVIRYY